jgi:hypothetical protein
MLVIPAVAALASAIALARPLLPQPADAPGATHRSPGYVGGLARQGGPRANGACLPDGSCLETDAAGCSSVGGTFNSGGDCSTTGRCLFNDDCIVTTQDCCNALSGLATVAEVIGS